ncbi:MAG: hypothetical protein HY909_29305 [Deltaproteobacteria bacterium]|nr:hypothetical protein [Deltaproteobacteria bacterium]
MTARVERLAGAAAAGLWACALPLGWWALPPRETLTVTVPGEVPWSVREGPAAPLAPLRVTPAGLRERLVDDGTLEDPGTGLSWRTWRVVYGHRWERAVYVPTLTGPFSRVGERWPCAWSVRLGAGLFDGSPAGGGGLSRRVAETLRPQFGRRHGLPVPFLGEVTVTRFGALTDARATLRPREGYLDAEVSLRLDDGTRMRVTFPVVLGRDPDGVLLVSRSGRASLSWSGPSYDQALSWCRGLAVVPFLGGACRSVADWALDAVLSDRIDEALGALSLAREVPLPGPGGVSFSPRIDAPPRVTARGVSFRVCPIVRVERPVDARVPGPVLRPEAPPPLPEDTDPGAVYAVVASVPALDQALWVAWQGGSLRALGAALRGRLPRELSQLALDVTSVDPRLPPVTVPSSSGLRVRVAEAALGTLHRREVRAHGVLSLDATTAQGQVTLLATPEVPRLDCVAPSTARGPRREPCLSDLGPIARERRWRPQRFVLDPSTLDALLRLRLAGVDLALNIGATAITAQHLGIVGTIHAL